MYEVEVIADGSGKWCGNARRFETKEEAEEYAKDLFARWTLVREWRVVEASNGEQNNESTNRQSM